MYIGRKTVIAKKSIKELVQKESSRRVTLIMQGEDNKM